MKEGTRLDRRVRLGVVERGEGHASSSETVEGTALTFEGVDDVQGGDRLALGVLGVSDRVSDDVLEEDLENSTGFFVNQTRDTFDSSSTSKTTDSRFGDTLDVVSQNLTMTFGTPFTETFSSAFTSSGHLDSVDL